MREMVASAVLPEISHFGKKQICEKLFSSVAIRGTEIG